MATAAISSPAAAGPTPPPGTPLIKIVAADAGAGSVDKQPDTLDIGLEAASGTTYPLRSSKASVTAAGGRAHHLGSFDVGPEDDPNALTLLERFEVQPCDIGGRDLPDAAFTVTTDILATGNLPAARYSQELRLGPDTTKPKVKKIQSSPPPGDEVKKGQTIEFEVVGKEDLPGATWQTGVQTLQVTGPRGVIKDKNAGRLPKACNEKSESLTINGKYKVKGGDPAVIEICGIAEDYAANEGSNCAQYYKGEVWEGTYRVRAEALDVANPCSFTLEGPAQVVVEPDGSLTGNISASVTEVMEDPAAPCVAVAPGAGPYPLSLSGNRDRNRFNVTVSGPYGSTPLELRVTGKTAEGNTQYEYFAITMKLKCKTCEE